MVNCLSVKQPWATLLIMGKKSIEIRKWRPWNVTFPCRVLIHTGLTVDTETAKEMGFGSGQNFTTGAILGEATFVGVKTYQNYSEFEEDYELHLNPPDWFEGGLIGFIFKDPIMYKQPIPFKGKLGFFEVDDNDLQRMRQGGGDCGSCSNSKG